VLSESAIESLKNLETTKDIYAQVACDDGRGQPKEAVTGLVNHLSAAQGKGVKFKPGLIYVDDFNKEDSIVASRNFGLTVDRWQKDVRVGWSFANDGQPNRCDGKKNAYGDVLSPNAVDSIKSLPRTKDIYAYVYCDDGRGLKNQDVTYLIEFLTYIKANKGIKFEPGTLCVDSFWQSDSIKAQREFGLTLDLPPQDVRIGWSFTPFEDSSNPCDGRQDSFNKVLSEEAIDFIQLQPRTKDIYAYVYCDQGRGPSNTVKRLVDVALPAAQAKGVLFEPGTLYVSDFYPEDSIKARQMFNLTITKAAGKGK
jgi:hypothetical protein